jgi:hypothetical protein
MLIKLLTEGQGGEAWETPNATQINVRSDIGEEMNRKTLHVLV